MGQQQSEPRLMKLTPALEKTWLYLFSGVTWSAVGIYLCILTIEWFSPVAPITTRVFVTIGLLLAFIIFRFGFSVFAYRNLQRIESMPKKRVCIFAFQSWTNYPLVVFMISLGIFLRIYSPIPKSWLGILYIGIGGGLFFASLIYYRAVLLEGRHD